MLIRPPYSVARRNLLKGLAATTLLPGWTLGRGRLEASVSDADVQFFRPGDTAFAQHRQLYNTRIQLTPAVIAFCANERGVQKALRYAIQQQLPVAVKSGGHGFEGFSLNEGGLVVDLSALRRCTLNAAQQLVAQPGCTLAELNAYLLPKGRLLPAGSCGGVGIAGLALGGGYGLFSRQFGLTCDHMQQLRVVDGRGEVYPADAELLWGCRGAGNAGLGIATEFTFATHRAPLLLQSHRFRVRHLSPQQAAVAAEQWFAIAAQLPPAAFSAFVMNGHTLSILLTCSGNSVADMALGAALTKLTRLAGHAPASHTAPLQQGIRRYYGRSQPNAFKNVSAGFYQTAADVRAVLPAIFTQVAATGLIFQINTFGGSAPSPALAASSVFAHRHMPFLGELQAYLPPTQKSATRIAAVNDIQRLLTLNGVAAHYSSYPDIGLTHWASAYYGSAALPRLRALKQRIDPDNRICHPQSIVA